MSKGKPRSSKKRDNLEAARIVRDALSGFAQEEQKRILRWAAESLGIGAVSPIPPKPTGPPQPPTYTPAVPTLSSKQGVPNIANNVKTFVDEKNPQTDIQLATAIAYFYRFEAPEAERKDEIDAIFLSDACRLAGRPGKLLKPAKTLNNAHAKGLLDRGARGKFSINSVGENLVGMTLPVKLPAKKASNK
jgi:hypothetical protein